ncbi:MAG: hypothetical protein ACRDUA_00850 [Micromonosporaceae bacterium]
MTHGGSHEAGRSPMRRGIRIAAVFLALAALTIPMAYVFASFWSVTSRQVADVTAEQRGVRYLGPMTHLIGVLSQTESATLNGKAADVSMVRAAMAKVAAADRRDGAALGATERWTKLRNQIEATLKDKPAGHEAYHAYANLNTTALALVTKVGDTSMLSADQTFATNTTLLLLPPAIVHAGQVADLLRPADTGPAGTPANKDDKPGGHDKDKHKGGGNEHAGESAAAPAARVAVALDRISAARNTLRSGLQRGGGGTVVSPQALDALDEFSAAVVALTEAAKPAAGAEEASISDADGASERARKAALTLTDQMLDSLSSQLSDRVDELTGDRLGSGIAMVVGVVLAAILLWLGLPGPAERWREAASGRGASPYDQAPDRGASPYQRAHVGEPLAPAQDPDLIDARELLSNEELLRVGRAVRATRGEPEDGSH